MSPSCFWHALLDRQVLGPVHGLDIELCKTLTETPCLRGSVLNFSYVRMRKNFQG